MSDDYQRMAANAISHEAFCAGQAWQQAAAAHERPCVLWKPRLFIDGNQWCALFGENIQEGVVGFGDSPEEAMWAFDAVWRKKLEPLPGAQPSLSIPEGWKLVPIEPTYEMLEAGEGTFVPTYTDTPVSVPFDVYRAMLAAAPEAKP